MEAVKLFHGLTEAMYESLGQALIIYLLARLVIFLLPWMDSAFRYRVLYAALSLSFLLFGARLVLVLLDGGSLPQQSQSVRPPDLSPHLFSIKALVHYYALEISLLYVAGIVLQTVLLATSILKVQWYKDKRYLQQNELWQIRLEALMMELGIKRKVALFFGERISGPFTAGWLKPVILFPLAALNNLSTEQVEAILVHELAHIKRNDYFWNFLQRLMEMLLFFNPVTWVLSAEIKREREYCCDDVVLRQSDATVSYAKALFLLEQSRSGYSLMMQAAGQKNCLLDRIKRLTDMETSKSTGLPKAIVLTGLMVTVLFLGWVKPLEAARGDEHARAREAKRIAELEAQCTMGLQRNEVLPRRKTALATAFADTVSASPFSPAAAAAPAALPASAAQSAPAAPAALPARPALPAPPADSCEGAASATAKYFKSAEWKQEVERIKKQSEDIANYFKSDEWKNQMESLKKQVQDIQEHFSGDEGKARTEAIKRQAEEMKKHFESPEWKGQIAKVKSDSEGLAKYFNSPEWKQQMEDIKKHAQEIQKQFESLEWKKRAEDQAKNAAEAGQKTERPKKATK
ncbi:M56 family metallopeptidase [Arcticibacter sp. MXS-1]|uniref:M56 family metallopeptidase n=1 Tax=Arcticibacter sp. MXS-1 TaxID=3341726 RepID=UPI0035A915BD